jgi:capsule biosynthesis phosphatase
LRVCVDLDGTICELTQTGDYANAAPVTGAREALRLLRGRGAYIIIYTARRMRTQDGDVSKVLEEIGELTRQWLKRHDIPYDEIVFGKPYAHVYIDDLAHRFETWEGLPARLLDAPEENDDAA